MEPVSDSLFDLERYRRKLELDIIGLRRGLQNWQTWDAEYEALKEEIEAAEEDEYEKIQNDFSLELVQRKEVDEVIGEKGQRTQDQMINILDRRIDYVTRNIKSLEVELQQAERKYATATVVSQPDEAQDEEGQPITEILEELDEDGNVLSYKLNRPAHNMSHVVEALKKAGVEDVPGIDEKVPIKLPSAQGQSREAYLPKHRVSEALSLNKKGPSPKMAPKKSVSFAEDSHSEDEAPRLSRNAIRVENIMESAKQQTVQNPYIPEHEDPEEAKIRQEMLRYSMNEVGAVVGELELDELGSEDEDWDMSDEGFDEEESDDEDKYGRNGRIVTDKYAQRMLELERKLGIQSRFTKDSRADTDGDVEPGSDDERIGRIVVNHNAESSSQPSAMKTLPSRPKEPSAMKSPQEKQPKKKGVRFADSLDVSEASAPAPAPAQPAAASITEREPITEPMSDLIVERDPSTRNATTKSDRKPSRFKKAQTNAPEFPRDINSDPLDPGYGKPISAAPSTLPSDKTTPPFGPPDNTLSEDLVERNYLSMPMSDFMQIDSDEEAEDVNYQELAATHQNLRRKFIQREGGFLKEDENPIQPLDEEDGGPQRQSRFKAARLSRQ